MKIKEFSLTLVFLNFNLLKGCMKENSLKRNEYLEKYVIKKNEHKRKLDIKNKKKSTYNK